MKCLTIFFTILLLSCSETKTDYKYYYDVYSHENKRVAYYEIITNEKDSIRENTKIRYDLNGKETDRTIEIFKIEKDTLFAQDENGFFVPQYVINNNCTTFLNKIRICFVYEDTDKRIFTKEDLSTDGVKSEFVFDSNFNLIQEEYLDGYLPYYRIQKREKAPLVLKNKD